MPTESEAKILRLLIKDEEEKVLIKNLTLPEFIMSETISPGPKFLQSPNLPKIQQQLENVQKINGNYLFNIIYLKRSNHL